MRWYWLASAIAVTGLAVAPSYHEEVHTRPQRPSAGAGRDRAHELLRLGRTFRCVFDTGAWTDFAAFPPPIAVPFSPAGDTVVFDTIDRSRLRAREIASGGAGEVTMVVGSDALSFLEVTRTGNPVLTTVFATLDVRVESLQSQLLAVSVGAFGATEGLAPRVATLYGSCSVTE